MPPKSYFGYVEREADSYVNWADVGRTITNTVDEIDRVRTEKKAAIDKAYKDGLEFINNRPAGENEEANKLTMNLAYNSAENLKIQYNLLKSGKVQVKDFAAYVQNQNDNVKGFYETIGTIQESFKKRQDRMKAGASQGIEILGGEDLEKYGNIGNLEAYYNANGSLTFGLLGEPDKDGVRKVLPGVQNIMSVNQLKGAVNEEYNKYDYVKDASGFVERLGKDLMSYRTLGDRMKAGTITEIVDKTGELTAAKAAELGITDPKELERLQKVVSDYKEAETLYIEGALSEYNMSSVITEELKYKPTFDKALADKDPKTYMYAERQTNGVIKPFPTPEQEAEAKEFMRKQMRQMIDKTLNIKPYTDQAQDKTVGGRGFDEGAAKWAAGRASKQKAADKILNLKVGDVKEKEASFNYITGLKGIDQSKTSYDPINKTLTVFSSDENKINPFIYQFEDLYDNNGNLIRPKTEMSNEDFVFQLLSIAYPDLEEEYADYLSGVNKEKTENKDLPKEEFIRREKERMKRASNKLLQGNYYGFFDYFSAKNNLEKLEGRQGEGGGLNASNRKK